MTAPGPEPSRAGRLAVWRTAALRTLWRTSRAVADLPGLAATEVRHRFTPLRAAGAGAAAVTVVVATVAAVTMTSPPEETDSRWVASFPGGADGPEPPPHQPLRSFAVPPEPSPPAGAPGGPGGPGGQGDPSGPLPPEVTGEFTAWALMDTSTGVTTGSDNLAQTSTTASMIKVWLVADYLRMASDNGEQPLDERLEELSLIIRDSDNELTQVLFEELDQHESIHRLISICGLTDSEAAPYYWSNTRLSPRDTARMGACLAGGLAAGPEWTQWVLAEMRQVRGLGDFGIRHALPEEERSSVAIKNGWVVRTTIEEYHVNCLAIGDGWTMGVLTRYPAHLGYEHGAEICRSLAAEHLP